MDIPRLVDFQLIGNSEIGYLSVAENSATIPFVIRRVYWVYGTPDKIERGNHANKVTEQVIVSVKGTVDIFLVNIKGEEFHFTLKDPNQGLYVPPMYWRRLRMGPEVVCLSLSSTLFDETDYIRNFEEFLKLKAS